MNNYRISNAGITIPKMIYGTAWKKENTRAYVLEAIESGFRGIDTACQPKHYNEKGVGDALEEIFLKGIKREEFYIQTKFTPLAGQDPHAVPYNPHGDLASQVRESIDVSLKNLRVEYIDSLILHSPLFPFSHTQHVWEEMERAFEKGLVKQLGISNCYDLNLLEKIYNQAHIKPSVVQNRFYQESNYDKDLREFCNRENILYQSFWSLTANPHILGSKEILTLAQKYNKTEAQIFFAYLIKKNITPLTGTTSKVHMLEDLDILQLKITEQEEKIVDKLFNF